jgi:hypothetical protein
MLIKLRGFLTKLLYFIIVLDEVHIIEQSQIKPKKVNVKYSRPWWFPGMEFEILSCLDWTFLSCGLFIEC